MMIRSSVLQSDDSRSSRPPTVSVVIPAYNAATHISGTLQSVLDQTFTDFEVIVINDGSPDSNELEIALRPFLKRIIYLKQRNQGPSAARNLGITRAKGQFIAFLDSDDSWLPNFLREQMRLFEHTPSLDLVYSDAFLCSMDGAVHATYMETCPSKSPVSFENLLVEASQVITSGTVARKQAIVDAGMFDERFHCSEDYDLWLRIAHRGGVIGFQRKVLLRHLMRPNSLSADVITKLEHVIRVLTKLDGSLQLTAERAALLSKKRTETEAYWALERGKRHLLAGDIRGGANSLLQANRFFKSAKLSMALVGLRMAPCLTVMGFRCWQRILPLMDVRAYRTSR